MFACLFETFLTSPFLTQVAFIFGNLFVSSVVLVFVFMVYVSAFLFLCWLGFWYLFCFVFVFGFVLLLVCFQSMKNVFFVPAILVFFELCCLNGSFGFYVLCFCSCLFFLCCLFPFYRIQLYYSVSMLLFLS